MSNPSAPRNPDTPSRVLPKEGKLLYHVTHIDNLPSIMEEGLLSRNALAARGIQPRSSGHRVPGQSPLCKQVLSDYVSFYFYGYNPFTRDFCRKPSAPGTREYDSEDKVLITINRKNLDDTFQILPVLPAGDTPPEILSYDAGFEKIRWDIVNDLNCDLRKPEILRAALAECVVRTCVPFSRLFSFYVKSETALERVRSILPEDSKISINGPTVSIESKRSSIPPCPGIKLPKS